MLAELSTILIVVGAIEAALLFLVPFMVFSIQANMAHLRKQQQQANVMLAGILEHAERAADAAIAGANELIGGDED